MLFAGIIACSIVCSGADGASSWELEFHEGATELSSRRVGGEREYRVRGTFDVEADRLWAALNDVSTYSQIFPYLVEASVLEAIGGVTYIYQRIDPPLLSERDCVLRVETSREGKGWRRDFRVAKHPKAPRRSDDVVRLATLRGAWTVEPVEGDRTRVTYRVLADPGGAIPRFIAERIQRTTLPDILTSLVEEARRRPRTR